MLTDLRDRPGHAERGPDPGHLPAAARLLRDDLVDHGVRHELVREPDLCKGALGNFRKLAKICKFLAGSFSAVSKRNFARK